MLIFLAACSKSTDPLALNTPAQGNRAQPATNTQTTSGSQILPSAEEIGNKNATIITADNPRIRYTGRVDFSDPLRPAFDWPAVTIKAAFVGTSLTVFLEDGQNLYNVYIDGRHSVLDTYPDRVRYLLAEDLPDGEHSFRMTKRTETFYGTPVFLGFELDADGYLLELPSTSGRRIEFIGDSITAGYGSEGTSPTCVFSAGTENVELTYAAMTARELLCSVVSMDGSTRTDSVGTRSNDRRSLLSGYVCLR